MKLISSRAAFIGLGLLFAANAASFAGEKEDALAKAPAAVQAAAKKALGDKKLEEFDKENVGGKMLYEVGYKVDGVDHAYLFSETGELVQEEADIDLAKVPPAVIEAVKKAEPKGTIKEAATVTAGKKHFIEVDVKVNEETHVVQVTPEGVVISDEIEKPVPPEK